MSNDSIWDFGSSEMEGKSKGSRGFRVRLPFRYDYLLGEISGLFMTSPWRAQTIPAHIDQAPTPHDLPAPLQILDAKSAVTTPTTHKHGSRRGRALESSAAGCSPGVAIENTAAVLQYTYSRTHFLLIFCLRTIPIYYLVYARSKTTPTNNQQPPRRCWRLEVGGLHTYLVHNKMKPDGV